MSEQQTIDRIFEGLMRRYMERVPAVGQIFSAMIERGMIASREDVQNDHVAFRTLGVDHLGIRSLEKVFLAHGFEKRDFYSFEAKKLNAYWYAPPENHYPRIFISELRVNELSDQSQAIIRKYTDTVSSDPIDAIDLSDWQAVDSYLHSSQWPLPTWDDYQTLLAESEYAAWAIYNRYYLNHFTISVHDLPSGFNTLEGFNEFLEGIGIVLNDSGGKSKISEDSKLKQSSTVAQIVSSEFRTKEGGTEFHDISGSYVEFAERLPLDEFAHLPAEEIRREHRRDGFEASNADKIFESTYTSQTQKGKD